MTQSASGCSAVSVYSSTQPLNKSTADFFKGSVSDENYFNAELVQHGSVTGSPPGTDDGRCPAALHDQDALGREAGQPKPYSPPGPGLCGIEPLKNKHPGQKVNREQITERDQRWIDIGSGMMSKVFVITVFQK